MPKRLLDDDASSDASDDAPTPDFDDSGDDSILGIDDDASTPDPTTDTCLPCDDQDQEVADDPCPFACDQPGCAKKCKGQQGLTNHKMWAHNMTVDFTCDLCNYKCKGAVHIKQHKANIHYVDVVWFRCDESDCDFKAKDKGHLTRHKANRHDIGVVWFRCDGSDCNYQAKQAGDLKTHKANMHDVDTIWHTCDADPTKCTYQSKHSSNLYAHIRRVHARVYAQRKKAQEERVRSALLAAGWKEYTLAETMPPVGFFRREKRIDFKCAKLESRTTWCRIDFVLGVPNGYIFLEVDEGQHKFGYGDELSCDMKRMACVMESLAVETEYNLPNLYWLRYNPNAWRVDGNLCSIPKVEREARLVAWLSSFECVNQFGIGYAFYDCEAADEDGAPGRLCVLENTEYNPQYASAVENLAGMQAK